MPAGSWLRRLPQGDFRGSTPDQISESGVSRQVDRLWPTSGWRGNQSLSGGSELWGIGLSCTQSFPSAQHCWRLAVSYNTSPSISCGPEPEFAYDPGENLHAKRQAGRLPRFGDIK
jgi:hypothetical protein